ncbi:MAG: hypothetical protein K2Y23_09170 [Cyanobacteria bacterium]|nr:hypothetical protein [Cyanobacteriota bacterium]
MAHTQSLDRARRIVALACGSACRPRRRSARVLKAIGDRISAAGLYGVLTTIASQYRREIGVRMALGAAWLDILRLVVRGLIVSAVGVAAGLVGVIGGARLLRGFLFSVTPTDPVAIGGAAVLMLSIAAVACYIPARRAAGGSGAGTTSGLTD